LIFKNVAFQTPASGEAGRAFSLVNVFVKNE